MKKLFTLLLLVYIGLSNIYWLPWSTVQEFRVTKICLYVAFFVLFILAYPKFKYKVIPKGVFSLSGFFLISLLLFPSIVLSNEVSIGLFYFNIFSFFSFLWAIYLINLNNYLEIEKIFLGSLYIIVFFCSIHIIDSTFNIFNLAVPEIEILDDFSETGFNLSRTGWSIGISLFIPISLLMKRKILKILFTAIIFYSQFITGGRAGLLISLFFIFMYVLRQHKIYLILMSVAALFFVFNSLELITQSLRFDRLIGKSLDFETLNSFSANRLEGYSFGLKSWLENPFFGNGVKNVWFYTDGKPTEIHNFWIKTLAESGLLAFLFFAFFVSKLYKSSVKKLKEPVYLKYRLIIIGGLIATLFEPNAVFGSFQNYAIWWLVASVVLSKTFNFDEK